jgi:hypothetical protein
MASGEWRDENGARPPPRYLPPAVRYSVIRYQLYRSVPLPA